MNFAASSDVELFGLVAKLAASPEHVRFAAEVGAAGEVFDKMIGKITVSTEFAAFLAAAERECARWTEWQRQQDRLSAVFAQPRGAAQRLRKRTIVRPEVTTQIGFHRR